MHGKAVANTGNRYQELIWAGFIVATIGCGLMIMLDAVRLQTTQTCSTSQRVTKLLHRIQAPQSLQSFS